MISILIASTLLVQSGKAETEPVTWEVVISGDMAASRLEGGPEKPSNEMQTVSGTMVGQVVLTSSESRFIFSVFNCANGVRRLEAGIDVPIEMSVPEQVKRFRSTAGAVSMLQTACGVEEIDPLTGNFAAVLEKPVARNKAYRTALAKWATKRGNADDVNRT